MMWRPRISLKAVFVVMGLLALVLGWGVRQSNRPLRQKQAVEAVRSMGGVAVYDFYMEKRSPEDFQQFKRSQRWRDLLGNDFFLRVDAVLLFDSNAVDEDLSVLRLFGELKILGLAGLGLTNRGLDEL